MYKSCNIIMLPIDVSERYNCTEGLIVKCIKSWTPIGGLPREIDKLLISKNWSKGVLDCYEAQHIYITSDEEIKDGDYCYNRELKVFFKYFKSERLHHIDNNFNDGKLVKIIATTNTLLDIVKYTEGGNIINGGHPCLLPHPSQQFIQYYIEEYNKGNVITKVNVEYEQPFPENESIFDCLKVNPDNTINIKPIKDNWNNIDLTEFFKKLVVRGCFRDTESKSGRNYNIALQTFAEEFGLDYESEVDKL